MTKPRTHIDISRKDNVETTSAGKVTQVNWRPEAGQARQEEIAKARQEAHQAHLEYLKSLTPEEQRLLKIEARLTAIEAMMHD